MTLIVDFASTANPLYQGWSMVLPDYLVPTRLTWVLHGLWTAGFAALLVAGWMTGGRDRTTGPGGVADRG